MLDRNLQSALNAQQRASDAMTQALIKFLYLANVLNKRKTRENRIEVKVGDRPVYAARLNQDGAIIERKGTISSTELKAIQTYAGAKKGQKFEGSPDVEFRVNGKTLFNLKDGVVLQNDLPKEFKQMARDQQLFPVEAQKPAPILVALNEQTKGTPLQKLWNAAAQMPETPMGSNAPPKQEQTNSPKLGNNLQAIELFEKASNVLVSEGVSDLHEKGRRTWTDGQYEVKQQGDKSLSIQQGDKPVLTYPGQTAKIDFDAKELPGAIAHFSAVEKQMAQGISQQVKQEKQLQTSRSRQTAPGLDV
jgi:hypothetical protein